MSSPTAMRTSPGEAGGPVAASPPPLPLHAAARAARTTTQTIRPLRSARPIPRIVEERPDSLRGVDPGPGPRAADGVDPAGGLRTDGASRGRGLPPWR